jgi:hypothetical protein
VKRTNSIMAKGKTTKEQTILWAKEKREKDKQYNDQRKNDKRTNNIMGKGKTKKGQTI